MRPSGPRLLFVGSFLITVSDSQTLKNLWSPEETVWGMGDVPGLWDGNPVKFDCYDHYTTTDVINSFE